MQYAQQTNIKVLVGNASVRSRLVLSGMIDAEPGLEVVDTARTKEELVHKALTSSPDMIVASSSFLVNKYLPLFQVVYQTGDTLLLMAPHQQPPFAAFHPAKKNSNKSFRTASEDSLVANGSKEDLLGKLREFAQGKLYARPFATGISRAVRYTKRFPKFFLAEEPLTLVVIGASTGGSKAIEALVKKLEMREPAVLLIALHMPEKFSKRFAKRLQKHTQWTVEEGYKGMDLKPRSIVIAPGGQNMIVRKNALAPYGLSIDFALAPVTLDTPSVDLLLQSAAACARERVLGVILSGMGTDGTAGAQEVFRQGGRVITQDEASSTIFGMAYSAIQSGVVSGVYALDQMHHSIRRFAVERSMGFVLESKLVG